MADFKVGTQLIFHPRQPRMVKLFKWYHNVHIVTSTTLCIVFWGYSLYKTLVIWIVFLSLPEKFYYKILFSEDVFKKG